ncbi:MAG TPA: DUF6585 family protein [Ktedonobacteraceae bacterium]|jgi:hypothetical protein|nr:DUF6585 family protein [Ktedonobacteraceae bacterium]
MAMNMPPQGFLSMPVQQAAAAQRLGPFMKSYKVNVISFVVGMVVCAGAGILFVGTALSPENDGTTMGFELVAALLFLALAVFLIYRFIQIGSRQIHLFQQGLVIEIKDQIQVFPWNQATEVLQSITRRYRNGIYVGTTYKYTLRRADGYQIKLDNTTKGIGELGEAVTKGITQELVPRALYSVRSGQTLNFAQFSINQQGIGNGHEFIPWPQVEAVNVNRGRLTVKKAGKFLSWGSSMVSRIPNFFVFLAVSEEMIRQAHGARQQGYY